MQKDQSHRTPSAQPKSKHATHRVALALIIFGIIIAIGLEVSGMHDYLLAFAALTVSAAFLTAVGACVIGARHDDDNAKSWTVSGALAFIGFAAAMIAN